MSKKCSVHSSSDWCNYDNVFKITWVIDGRTTNAFSSRGKRINQKVSKAQKDFEQQEAIERGMIVAEYLTGAITRKQAIERLQALRFLCPKNPTAHLLTMAEFKLELR